MYQYLSLSPVPVPVPVPADVHIPVPVPVPVPLLPYINEIHYDNVGNDVNEFIEIASPEGMSLSHYSIVGTLL
jgi:hypothetical protein